MFLFTVAQYKFARLSALVVLFAALSGCGGTAGKTSDTTRPALAGIKGSSSLATSITLNWGLASDDVTVAQNIVYLVYRVTTAGAENYTTPTYTTAQGALSYTDSGLTADTTYYYVVRAKDEAGNIDTNTIEIQANTDVTSPTFAGATGAAAQSSISIAIGWSAASDAVTAQGNIVYLIYRQNFTTSIATTAAGATSYIDSGLTASSLYNYVVQARDEAGNIDTNATPVSSTTTPPSSDSTPPTFAGVSLLTVQGSTSLTISWSAASDNTTSPANMVYQIYRATGTGGQNFDAAPFTTTSLGATFYTVTSMTDLPNYYYVVRARDEAGSLDTKRPAVVC